MEKTIKRWAITALILAIAAFGFATYPYLPDFNSGDEQKSFVETELTHEVFGEDTLTIADVLDIREYDRQWKEYEKLYFSLSDAQLWYILMDIGPLHGYSDEIAEAYYKNKDRYNNYEALNWIQKQYVEPYYTTKSSKNVTTNENQSLSQSEKIPPRDERTGIRTISVQP
jgi:hypothetical protein